MYKARIHHNVRNKHYSAPKVLLTNVTKGTRLFREHLWVNLAGLKKYVPKRNTYFNTIIFNAKEYEYISVGGNKYGLKNIRNIKQIKNLKEQT